MFDRNMNGNVDDGMELFGNAVTLPNGQTSMQGYEALAQFDRRSQGGNGNGFVDRGDRNFAKLRLWTDKNRNGVSERGELVTLPSKGVLSISLQFTSTPDRMDKNGNVLAFSAPAYVRAGNVVKKVETTDVFFVTVDPSKIDELMRDPEIQAMQASMMP